MQRATRDHVELAADSPVCYNARQPGDPRHLAGQMGYETTGALPMIDLPLMLAFIAAASLLTVTPGVDTAIVLRTATLEGRRQAVLAAAGICLGCLAWGWRSRSGSARCYRPRNLPIPGHVRRRRLPDLARLASAVQTSRLVRRGHARAPPAASGQAFWRGLLTNLLNPKVGVFYVTFLPQFVPLGAYVAAYSFFRRPACTADPGLVRHPDRGNDPARQLLRRPALTGRWTG